VLELVPAGHVVGGAQLLVELRGRAVLYAGGLRLVPGWLGEPAQVRRADVLVLDCPYDAREHAFPDRARAARALLEWVRGAIANDGRAVLAASELGTAQELCHLLASEGVPARVDRAVSRWSSRVRACGVPLGPAPELRRALAPGEVAVVSRGERGRAAIGRHAPGARVALVSGRAVLPAEVARAGAEIGFALSNHADSAALGRFVGDTGAGHVYLGPRHSAGFEAELRRAGLGVTRFAPPPGTEQIELDL
jgi:putative mRNA 3-end processing factor